MQEVDIGERERVLGFRAEQTIPIIFRFRFFGHGQFGFRCQSGHEEVVVNCGLLHRVVKCRIGREAGFRIREFEWNDEKLH